MGYTIYLRNSLSTEKFNEKYEKVAINWEKFCKEEFLFG